MARVETAHPKKDVTKRSRVRVLELRVDSRLGLTRRLKVPCAPNGFEFEFPILKTTKL